MAQQGILLRPPMTQAPARMAARFCAKKVLYPKRYRTFSYSSSGLGERSGREMR